MGTDLELLNDYIIKSGLKKNYIAEQVGLTYQGLLNKLKGKRYFSVPEILRLCKILKINKRDREKIFFNQNVDEASTRA